MKGFGRDADHGEIGAVDAHGAPENGGVGCEAAFPQAVAEDDDGLAGVFGNKRAAERGGCAQGFEIIGRYELATGFLNLGASAELDGVQIGVNENARKTTWLGSAGLR